MLGSVVGLWNAQSMKNLVRRRSLTGAGLTKGGVGDCDAIWGGGVGCD